MKQEAIMCLKQQAMGLSVAFSMAMAKAHPLQNIRPASQGGHLWPWTLSPHGLVIEI